VEPIRPDKEDYFVLKPMHSAFFQIPLEVLLRYLDSSSLILCGLATNSCIVCTLHASSVATCIPYLLTLPNPRFIACENRPPDTFQT